MKTPHVQSKKIALQNKEKRVQAFAQKVTLWIGSPTSIILHTIGFVLFFGCSLFGIPLSTILLVLTTIVSLEAIYLSLLIQMTVNYNTQSLEKVESDINEIEEDFGEIREDVEEITEDIGEMEEYIEAIAEEVEEITEEDKEEVARDKNTKVTLDNIHESLRKLMKEIEELKQKSK